MLRRSGRRRSSRASGAPAGRTTPISSATSGCVRFGGAAGDALNDLDVVGVGRSSAAISRDRVVERARRRVAAVHDDLAPVGHDVVGDARLDPHDLQRLPVLEAVDVDRRAPRSAAIALEQRRGAVDRVHAHPRPGRMRARAVERGAHVDRALAAGLDPPAGRLEQDREVARDEIGALGEQPAQPVVLVGDLLAVVEHEGHVALAGVARETRPRAAAAPRGRPSCRRRRGRAACRRRGAASRCRWRARCRDGRRARRGARAPCSVRATTLCADALDLAASGARSRSRASTRSASAASSPLTDGIAQSCSVSASRSSAHETMPCSRRIALSFSLSCSSPSAR